MNGIFLKANNRAVFYSACDGCQVAAFAGACDTLAAYAIKSGTVGTAKNIFAPYIKKPVTEHIERRSCVRTVVQKNRDSIVSFLNKYTCSQATLGENNFFAAVVRQVSNIKKQRSGRRRALQISE